MYLWCRLVHAAPVPNHKCLSGRARVCVRACLCVCVPVSVCSQGLRPQARQKDCRYMPWHTGREGGLKLWFWQDNADYLYSYNRYYHYNWRFLFYSVSTAVFILCYYHIYNLHRVYFTSKKPSDGQLCNQKVLTEHLKEDNCHFHLQHIQ